MKYVAPVAELVALEAINVLLASVEEDLCGGVDGGTGDCDD